MPKFIAAMLCGALIVTFPTMLDLTLSHAENIEKPALAYGLLAGTTVLFCGLIAWYMWLSNKAAPSALANTLRETLRIFRKSIGEGKDSETAEVTSVGSSVASATNQPVDQERALEILEPSLEQIRDKHDRDVSP